MRPEDLLGYLRNAADITIIIGAGASKKAKIPLAGELVTKINGEFDYCLGHLSAEDRTSYGKVMGALSPSDRKKLIEPLLDEARISWGQIALAALIRGCNLRRILTFNFDLVLERAASLMGLHIPVYDFGVAPTQNVSALVQPAIYHLHGQSYGLRLLNTDAETAAHQQDLRPLLADSLRNHVVLVCGYSGETDAAFEVMEQEYNDQNHLFWLGYSDHAKPHLKRLLDKNYARYLGGCDFDGAMMTLAKGLGVWPPTFVTNPPAHLLDELEDVADFPLSKEHDRDLLSILRGELEKARDEWEGEQSREGRVNEAVIGGRSPSPLTAGEVAKLSSTERQTRAWSLYHEAGQIWWPAIDLKDDEARKDHEHAMRLYEEAISLSPDFADAHAALGAGLGELALRSRYEVKTVVIDRAVYHFERAYEIDPADPRNAANLATILYLSSIGRGKAEGFSQLEKARAYADIAISKEPGSNDNVALLSMIQVEIWFRQHGSKKTEAKETAVEQLDLLKDRSFYPALPHVAAKVVDGDFETALSLLEEGYLKGKIQRATRLSGNPIFDPIRDDPRFVAILEKLEAD